jgi:hypothetical protein
MKCALVASAAVAVLAGSVQAGVPVEVTINGIVEYNFIGDPPLGGVGPGDDVVMSFMVDSDNFVEGVPGDTRGYVIDESSFLMTFGDDVSQMLVNPFPPGQTPYFTLVEGFPVSDGFFVSTSEFSPGGVPLEQEPVQAGFNVGYTGDTLDSLDILDALGTYDYDGLTNFGFGLWIVFPDNVVLGIEFVDLTISAELGVTAAVDIKPGSCPNPLNRKSRGKLPVGVLGTMDFDVLDIDLDSIVLTRADGVGGAVMPIRSSYEDVGAPFDGMPCECAEYGPDGFDDLTLKFKTQEIVSELELGMLPGGAYVELMVSGFLLDGTPFEGTDCIKLVPAKAMPGMFWGGR